MFIIIGLPIILMSIIFHEVAHGWAAYKCGDPTAKNAGRLTLNPFAHIDLQGTIIIPGILIAMNFLTKATVPVIGWAKPVPINPAYFRDWKKGMGITGIAGPLTNIVIALVLSFLLRILLLSSLFFKDMPILDFVIEQFSKAFAFAGLINIVLAVFNMIPIPPLDGSRVVVSFLRPDQIRSYLSIEPYGIMIVFGILIFGGFRFLWPIITFLFSVIFGVPISF
ncbi:MAG: site-2 protease family protein [bacterium]|nr:site-2 protease family protein [bacterium]